MQFTNNRILPNIHLIFLQAIEFPSYARSEFFIKEQVKSGWSRGVYLRTLMAVHEHYQVKIDIYSSKERRRLEKQNQNLFEDFGIDLEQETNGNQKGKLTKAVLEDLRFAIVQAYKFDKPKPEFDSYQILTFCERMLLFIKGQFDDQVVKTGSAQLLAERYRKQGTVIEGNPVYLTYHYHIISDAPIFDYYRFRNEVRKLLLTSQTPGELKTILRPLFDLSIRIVDLWNNELQPIEEPSIDDTKNAEIAIRDQRLITFDHQTLQVWHSVRSEEEFFREPSSHFLNRDFAIFASRVANLIASEILKEKTEYKVREKVYSNFDELFVDASLADSCYKILIEEEIIDDQLNYRGKLKSALVIWVRELGKASLVHHQGDSVYNDLLNKKIKGLNFSLASYRKPSPKAKELYESNFRKELSQLSQQSQKRNL